MFLITQTISTKTLPKKIENLVFARAPARYGFADGIQSSRDPDGATRLVVEAMEYRPSNAVATAAFLYFGQNNCNSAEDLFAPQRWMDRKIENDRTPGAIDIRGLSFSYGHRPIVAGISYTIGAGEHVAIIGHSGAGKSTLLYLLAGLLHPAAGLVAIGGVPVAGPAPKAVLMFQRPALLPWATARDNITLPLRFSGALRRDPRAARERVDSLLVQIGLADRANALPAELSGGQQQRVALARALATEPNILLLDEPFSALDPQTRAALRWDVRRLARARGATLVTVTHDLADAVALADRAIVLAGSPATIVDDIAVHDDGERQLRLRLAGLREAARPGCRAVIMNGYGFIDPWCACCQSADGPDVTRRQTLDTLARGGLAAFLAARGVVPARAADEVVGARRRLRRQQV